MRKFFTVFGICTLLVSVSFLSSCRTYKSGTITEKRVQIASQDTFDEYDVSVLNRDALSEIANNYTKHGDGEVRVTVTYDPKSKKQTAMKASSEAARISETLHGMNVPVSANIMPVMHSGNMKALVSYEGYVAVEPDCGGTLPGLEDRDHSINLDYKMGCSVETMIARQIARPKDLMGREVEASEVDARALTNQASDIRFGARNEALGGETASQ